jgi:ABC-type polysaccharide transport system permease subunit
MKVVFPKHIKKGIFATMSFNIWPLTISVIQLFILAMGIAISLAIFNQASASGSKMVWLVVALPVFLLFVIIAFFQISELSLIPFIAKLIRTYFFDTTRKYQVNFDRADEVDILLKESHVGDQKDVISYKTKEVVDPKVLEQIEKGWLL